MANFDCNKKPGRHIDRALMPRILKCEALHVNIS
mgnify:CR=1 FL=1